MSLEELISTYGYAAIAIGTLLEGETMLILGGLAAYRGYLKLPWVLVCAFLGTLLGDQLYFYIGRAKGRSILEKRRKWKSKSEKVFSLLNKHQVLLILGFRFLYGLRTVTPMALGASRVAPLRFLILNILGALTWTIVIGVMGYLFGHTLEVIIGDMKHYEVWLFIGLAALGVIMRTVHLLSNK
jgi:membrane protein DedA with SNARE-associated domain